MVDPHFKMFWNENVPRVQLPTGAKIKIIAGNYKNDASALEPPPDSWAANPLSELLIWIIELEKAGEMSLPETESAVLRNLYFYSGESIHINDHEISSYNRVEVMATEQVRIFSPEGEGKNYCSYGASLWLSPWLSTVLLL